MTGNVTNRGIKSGGAFNWFFQRIHLCRQVPPPDEISSNSSVRRGRLTPLNDVQTSGYNMQTPLRRAS